VFKGVQRLVEEGYLTVRKGVGTFVASVAPQQAVGLLMNESCFHPQTTPFPYVLGQKLEAALAAAGYAVKRFTERHGAEFTGGLAVDGLADSLQRGRLRGLVMANCDLPMVLDRMPLWRDHGVPCASVHTYGLQAYNVAFDYAALLDQALGYFAAQGRARVAFLCSEDVLRELAGARARHPQMRIRPEWLRPLTPAPSPEADGFAALSALWSLKQRPDALLVSDDIVTKGVAQAALKLGIRVPEQLLIVHAANSDTGVFYPFAMPRIEYNLDEIVTATVAAFRCALAGDTGPGAAQRKIRPRLVTR